MSRVATTIWRIGRDLVLALDERLGTPLDSYVNGTQTWLTGDESPNSALEWRLHPAGGYQPPPALSHYELWDQVVGQLAAGADPGALELAGETRALASIWGGLECFAAYGDDIEPAPLAAAATEVLGRPPEAQGTVDHERLGTEWEQSRGRLSLTDAVLEELES
jgi:hypothetical protein